MHSSSKAAKLIHWTSYPLRVAVWITLLSLATCQGQNDGPTKQPNILFLITDQQRYDAIGRVQHELAAYNGTLKVRTPNLDRLSQDGAYVRTVYTQCPVCGPARTSLRTGCTIERTGVQTNPLTDNVNNLNRKLFQEKIDELEGLDQILVEDHGYVSEYYGKWHIPSRLYNHRDGGSRAVQYNDYDYSTGEFTFEDISWDDIFQNYLEHFHQLGAIDPTFASGQQEDSFSKYPYTPIGLDSRFGMPTNTPLNESNSFDSSESSQIGNVTSGKAFSASFLNHDVALRALDRLAAQDKPFLLTVSYHHPHPPFMAPFEYLSYYWDNRDQLFAPPNVGTKLDHSTSYYTRKEQLDLEDAGYCDADNVKEWTAVYYAMVEEIDTLVGTMLDRLDELDITDNTLVVFASDHGEMLGAHCLRGKNKFFEESTRVPLFLKLPGVIPAGSIVDEPVSLIDVFSTILDYAGAKTSDKSDGTSIRRFIEGTSYNNLFDETAVVSEWDYREPIDAGNLTRDLDSRPNFMIRHGEFKLLIHKLASSRKPDVLYNLTSDPYEMNNLINRHGPEPDDATIGKAEHLRYLLLDWMERMQSLTSNQFYSDPIYNAYEGKGDIEEIRTRQSWRASDFWVGDSSLVFRKVSRVGSKYIRNEWLYLGRRSPGSLALKFQIVGQDAPLFHLSADGVDLLSMEVYRLKVTLEYDSSASISVRNDAYLQILYSTGDPIRVPLLVDPRTITDHPPDVADVSPLASSSSRPCTSTSWHSVLSCLCFWFLVHIVRM